MYHLTYVSMHVCMYACMYVWMYLLTYVRMYACMISTYDLDRPSRRRGKTFSCTKRRWKSTNPTALVRPRVRAHANTCTQTHACMHTRIDLQKKHMCSHARMHMYSLQGVTGPLQAGHVTCVLLLQNVFSYYRMDSRASRESRGVAGGTTCFLSPQVRG